MIDDVELFAECKMLGATIAPELEFYLTLRPPGYDVDGISAVAVNGPCPVLKRHLEDGGQWRGPRPVVVFVNSNLSREQALVVMLHEMAHLLPARPIADVIVTQELLAECEAQIEVWKTDPYGEQTGAPRWAPNHDKQFHLRTLHLWWRSAIAGVVLPLDGLAFGDGYDLAPCYSFWKAFGSAGVLMKDLSFDEIAEAEAPQEFTALWLHNLKSWMIRNPEAVNERMKVA